MAITISGENNNDKILASDGVIDQISGFSLVGVVTATSFTGDLTGDVTGNLLGNVTGNINNSTLLLQTGGTERLRITSTGNIGLGVASPQGGGGDLSLLGNKALRWSNSGGTQYGDIYADTSSNIVFRNGSSSTERLRITSGGQVNIGTGELSQTDRMLNVYGGRQRITYTGPGNSFELMNSASAGNSYGLLIQGGTNSSDYNSTFRNTSGATLFRIRGDGYVGINQTSPQRYLHITGNDGATGATLGNSDTLLVLDNDGSNGAIIEFLGNATNGQGHIMFTDTGGTNRGRITYNHGSDYFRFDTAGSERLRILSNGNISVGSNGAAAEKFQVNGGNIAIVGGAGYKIDTHPLLTTASFTDISGGSYAARLGSTGTSTIRSTQIYGGGNHIATFDGVNYRLGINETSPDDRIEIRTTAHGQGITIKSTGNTSNALTFDANRGTEGVIGVVYGRWNGTTVAQMNFISGTDGTDKNDGVITFGTESAASNGNVNATERLRIDANGDINLGNNPTNQYGYKLNIEDSSQILYAQTASSGGTELKLYLDHGNTVANFGTVTSTDLAFVTSNTEKLRIASDGSLTSNANNNGQIIHTFKNDNTTAGSSAQTVEHWFRFNRTGGGMNHPAAKIVAGKEREWIGGATNQDGYLAFYTTLNENGGAERLRITSTGKVSLGSAPMPTPPSWLHVKGNTYQTLRLENYDGGSNGPYIELYNNSASPADNDYTGIISFKNRNSANEEITYSQIRSQSTDVTDGTEDGVLTFHTRHNGTFGERLRIASDGSSFFYHNGTNHVTVSGISQCNGVGAGPAPASVCFAVGRDSGSSRSMHCQGHLQFASGYGIDFSPTNNGGGTTTSEVLDDYEEGSFTPVLAMSSGGHSLGYAIQLGKYTKIGNMVHIEVYIELNAVSANGSGYLRLNGLPFTSISGSSNTYGGLHCPWYNSMNNVPMRGGLVERGNNWAFLYNQFESGTGTIQNASIASAFTTTSKFILVGSYTAA